MSIQGLAYLVLTLLLSLCGQLMLKWRVAAIGAAAFSQGPVAFVTSVFLDVWAPVALVFCGLSLLAWMHALSYVALAQGYSFLALLYVLFPICAWLLFDERLAPLQIGGIGLIVLGVTLVGLGATR